MKLETFKTFLLLGLIGLSLILTFSLWSYQTDYSGAHNTDPAYIPEADAGGDVRTKRDVIVPNKAIFHISNEHFGLNHPSRLVNMYEKIQEWSLTEYVEKEDNQFHLEEPYMEVEYPEALPIDMVKSLFTLADDIDLPNWNFERMFVSLEEEQSAVTLYFLSVDEQNYIQFNVYDQTAFTTMEELLKDQKYLEKYMIYNEENTPLHIPMDPVELRHQTLALDFIQPSTFVDALFRNPSLVVTPNFGESYFIDGQRDMRVIDNGLGLEFTNPLENVSERMSSLDLIDKSLEHINDHKGWTADFYLSGIDKTANRIGYQMYYDDYPVFDESNITVIEQKWRNQRLYKYNRPLFRLVSPLGGELTELPSGNDVIYFLENTDKYHIEKVTDVMIGYYVSDIDASSYSITLEPSWFMLYNGKWQRIRFDELSTYNQGGM